MVKIKVDDYEVGINLINNGEISPVVMVPKNGQNGLNTVYPNESASKVKNDVDPGFEFIDTEHDNRFKYLATIENVSDGNQAFLFRDSKEKRVILVSNLKIPKEILALTETAINVEATTVIRYTGIPDKNSSVKTKSFEIENFNPGFPNRTGDNGTTMYNQFVSIGGTSDVFGDDVKVKAMLIYKTLTTTHATILRASSLDNMIIPVIV